jgi:hypothetical protein
MSMTALKPTVVTASTLTLNYSLHNDGIVVINRAAGCTVTLPAATGSGARFRVMVGTTISSGSFKLQVANASDTMAGHITTSIATGAAGADFGEALTGTDDTITCNGTTTGGIAGSYIEAEDVAANLWRINGALIGSGSVTSSVSAAVS